MSEVKQGQRGNETSGVVYGNIGIGETTYEMNKFQASRGYGFAAERAEHMHDILHGQDAQILGDDNARDGADRIVNGVEIQSKYCQSGAACIQACFRDGKYRYYSENGKPMQVEVPCDHYEDAVAAMRRRIERNEVPGVDNPADAELLVKKGHYTYEQAKKIAQAGTVESLMFDASTGMVIAANSLGITATVTFAMSLWNGEDIDTALENAALSGLKVGGVSFLTTVLSSQLARSSVNATIRSGTDLLVSKMGPRVTANIANSLSGGVNIYGAAAMNNVSKLLTGNIIASSVSLIVLSSGDIIDAFRGRVSMQQLAKNMTVTGAAITGGNLGWGIGKKIGKHIGGGIGTLLGGLPGEVIESKIGSKIGGFTLSAAAGATSGDMAHKALDQVVEDDSVKVFRIIEAEFSALCEEYLLTENEVYEVLSKLKERLSKTVLKDIYASQNRNLSAQRIVLSCIKEVVGKRERISCPDNDAILYGIRGIFESAIDGTGIFGEEQDVQSLMKVQERMLQETSIQEEQLGQIMKNVSDMNKVQMRAERSILALKRNNEDTQYKIQQLREERKSYQEELEKILEE